MSKRIYLCDTKNLRVVDMRTLSLPWDGYGGDVWCLYAKYWHTKISRLTWTDDPEYLKRRGFLDNKA